jgi:segregation and condensation protein B
VIELAALLEGHAMMLAIHDTEIALVTRPAFSALIETLRKEELSKELSKASAETLAIIAYTPGITKAQIEFIRGVNVSYTLRSLQMRGLIEQKGGRRTTEYHPTLELLHSFGVASIELLPHYAETKAKIEGLLKGEQEIKD